MALAEVDDLAAIFFGDAPRPGPAPAGSLSQCVCDASPCDTCDFCDKQAKTRACGVKPGLRHAATSCDTDPAGAALVANVAGCRNGQNGPQSEQRRGLSQMSQMSQGVELQAVATPMAGTTSASPAPEFLAMVAWTDADIARFAARRDRLTRWGWPAAEAEATAQRLTLRDRAGDDDRVSCAECKGYRPGRCGNHRAARLQSPEVGRDLAALLQRCPGFTPSNVESVR